MEKTLKERSVGSIFDGFVGIAFPIVFYYLYTVFAAVLTFLIGGHVFMLERMRESGLTLVPPPIVWRASLVFGAIGLIYGFWKGELSL